MNFVQYVRQAPVRTQVLLACVAFAVITGLLLGVYVAFLRTPYEVLFTNLRTADAATIVGELEKKKVAFRLADGGATILAPKKLADHTRLEIMGEDLPLKGTVGFELFNKSDMGLTEFAQRINYQRALQGELARTIMTMDAVDSARVHLSIAEPTIFREERRPSKASVTIVARTGQTISADAVAGVRRLVAASVPELDPADVVVLDGRGMLAGDPLGGAGAGSSQTAPETPVARYYRELITQALAAKYPPDTIQVAVSVEPAYATGSADAGIEASRPLLPGPPRETQDRPRVASPPTARDFRVFVSVSLAPPFAPEEEADIQRRIGEVIALDPMLGDQIVIRPLAKDAWGAAQSAASARGERPSHAGVPKVASPRSFWLRLLVPFGLLLLIGAFLLHRRNSGPRRLTAGERQQYAVRLKALIDARELHAAR